MLKKLAI